MSIGILGVSKWIIDTQLRWHRVRQAVPRISGTLPPEPKMASWPHFNPPHMCSYQELLATLELSASLLALLSCAGGGQQSRKHERRLLLVVNGLCASLTALLAGTVRNDSGLPEVWQWMKKDGSWGAFSMVNCQQLDTAQGQGLESITLEIPDGSITVSLREMVQRRDGGSGQPQLPSTLAVPKA